MAIEAVHNVFYLPLKPGPKLTLAVLAEHANEKGICWPENIAPFKVGIVNLRQNDKNCERMRS